LLHVLQGPIWGASRAFRWQRNTDEKLETDLLLLENIPGVVQAAAITGSERTNGNGLP